MASFNKVILMGGLTRDPELRQSASGVKVTELSLAVSEQWKDRATGESKESTCYVDVVVWQKQAELCCQYLSKGRQVLVEGRLQLDEWENQQGEKRRKLRVRADRVQFLSDGRRSDSNDSSNRGAKPVSQASEHASPPPNMGDDEAFGDDENDDLPF
jgi:single-strand DNA-binding protein